VTRLLSIRQPYASKIIDGTKQVENRTRTIEYRGRVGIHAALRPHTLALPHEVTAIRDGRLPVGVVLGTAQLVDCHRATPACEDECEPVGGYYPGGIAYPDPHKAVWHWVLVSARQFVTPIPRVRGMLGLFEATPTVEHLMEIADIEPPTGPTRVTAINPDCHVGKHDACNGDAWNAVYDGPDDCDCECHR
jgi:hypothetical protein